MLARDTGVLIFGEVKFYLLKNYWMLIFLQAAIRHVWEEMLVDECSANRISENQASVDSLIYF